MPRSTSAYHQLYLNHGRIEYITPICFEDGMDWQECELYYACILLGSTIHRSALHLQRSTKIRLLSKRQLKQQANGIRQSCLRTQCKPKTPTSRPRPPMRRSVSFNTVPSVNNSFSQYITDELKDLTSNGPRVNFDDYVSVTTIPGIEDYPEDVRQALWMSRDETDASMRSAFKVYSLRRQLELGEQSCKQRGARMIQIAINHNDTGLVLKESVKGVYPDELDPAIQAERRSSLAVDSK